jgi:hypothetical protein
MLPPSTRLVLVSAAALLLPLTAAGQDKQVPLESVQGLRLHNVTAEPATHQGRKGLRVTLPTGQAPQPDLEQLAVIEGLVFSSGVIEAEIAGEPAPGAAEGARGFVGIAFRLLEDLKTYDAFYLRPTNGRAEDQERRNHATQYISHPAWPWFRLRKETPSRYESYVDLVTGAWTKVRIEVRGDKARLYVHDNEQPALIINDVKTGATAKGSVALWLGAGTVAHFRALTVKAAP